MTSAESTAAGATNPVNRTDTAAFVAFLDETLSLAGRRSESIGLLLVQMTGLERLNMSLGYDGGNHALAELASRLHAAFGGKARTLRIGARTFAVVLGGVKGSEHALLAARRIEQLASRPVAFDGRQLSLRIVQGLALFPEHGRDGAELLRHAEAALTSAADNDTIVELYDGSATSRIRASLVVDEAVGVAMREGLVEPWFQPQVSLRERRIVGAEALLRCRNVDGSFIDPEQVVEAATRLRRLDEMTVMMLNASLRRAAEWQSHVPGLRVSVNVTAQTLRRAELVEQVRQALSIWSVPAPVLTLELTESVFMDHPQQCFDTMRELRDLGVRVAIDDFGTGYSSLSYFRDIPANELKVDRSFVADMLNDEASRRIVRAIIELAHGFGLEVVAEGVEDADTLRALGDMRCDLIQGYFTGRPMPAADFTQFLASRGR